MASARILLMLFLLLLPLSWAHFVPSDNHLIAAGASAAVLSPDGRRFSPDSSYLSSASGHKVSLSSSAPFAASVLYRASRVFHRPASYNFRVSSPGAHLVRFHFYPFADLAGAHFHVAIDGFALLTNFSTAAPIVKDFIVPLISEKLVVSFFPVDDSAFAFVNAIEVLSAPKDLMGDIATLVTPNEAQRFEGLSVQVWETIHRVNVGGRKVTPFNDTLWRTWIPDDEFFKSGSSGSTIVTFSGRIQYSTNGGGASREVVPDNVCNTARVLESNQYNLTWSFPVLMHNRYLVRMHFCDIASKALGNLYFDVYLNGYLGVKDVDLSTIGLASPYYVDFVVEAGDSCVLSVAIRPSMLSGDSSVQGLLNGLEIMQMNKTVVGMVAALPASYAEEDLVSKGFGEFVRSLLCGTAFVSLFVILFVMILKLRVQWRSRLDWSSLHIADGNPGEGLPLVPAKIVT